MLNPSAIQRARRVCLYDYLLAHHPIDVEREGNSLRLRCNHSVSIKSTYSGFVDFASGFHGNAIDCLVRFFGYTFSDAVAALCQFDEVSPGGTLSFAPPGMPQNVAGTSHMREVPAGSPCCPQSPLQSTQKVFAPPTPSQGQYRQLYAYLTQQRGIPCSLVRQLVDWGLLYQESEHNNLVFIDPARTFAELRGTNSYVPFHKVDFSDPLAFWWFKPHGPESRATVAFVCEGAIDAISLYLLLSHPPASSGLAPLPPDENALFCGIGGVANYKRIDFIKNGMAAAGCHTIIAVDNDGAGQMCRQRYPDCWHLVPRLKDWNADLLAAAKDGVGHEQLKLSERSANYLIA